MESGSAKNTRSQIKSPDKYRAFFIKFGNQNGFTITRMTMSIIRIVGTSLMIRQCLADFVFLSCAKRRVALER
jgi:hypothetical protein